RRRRRRRALLVVLEPDDAGVGGRRLASIAVLLAGIEDLALEVPVLEAGVDLAALAEARLHADDGAVGALGGADLLLEIDEVGARVPLTLRGAADGERGGGGDQERMEAVLSHGVRVLLRRGVSALPPEAVSPRMRV